MSEGLEMYDAKIEYDYLLIGGKDIDDIVYIIVNEAYNETLIKNISKCRSAEELDQVIETLTKQHIIAFLGHDYT